MMSEVSRTKALPPPPSAPMSTRLVPGFRFHPTDEELVSYYLKRKVTGQPIRVNPISELDLYKAEPWDLPPYSRLHSRDLEWYFFTSLDRKYSNRSRTSRATEEGYWKTTGKDRPVRRRSRTIGMKKTLVYHAGRAPRGRRTNWVMHEYRLEDDDLSHADILQDAYVLCRIFQKSGPGPQNGAQYGAPYEEDEWEGDEVESANVVHGDDALVYPEDYVHLSDFLENQDKGIRHSDVVPLVAKSAEQDIGSSTGDLSSPMEKIQKDEDSVEDFFEYIDFLALQENTTILNGSGENFNVNDQSTRNIGFVQLNDIVGEENTCLTSGGYSDDCPFGGHDDISIIDGELLGTIGVNSLPDQLRVCTVQHDMQVEPYDTDPLTEDHLMFYDALGYDVQCLENSFSNEAALVPSAGYDFLEELMAYYDATDATLHYDTTDSIVAELSSTTEAAGSCTSSSGAVSDVENVSKSASLFRASNIDHTLGGSTEKLLADIRQKDPQGKTLMKRLASVLESISAPPAFAAEPAISAKMSGRISAASTSSFRITAHMIQIQSLTDTSCSESHPLPNHHEPGFLVSYAPDDEPVSKSPLHALRKCGFFSLFFGGGFHSFFISVLVLALSYRVGIFVYNLGP